MFYRTYSLEHDKIDLAAAAVPFLLAHPDLALLALFAGFLCVCVEFLRPGTVIPGALGSALMLLALQSLVTGPLPADRTFAAILALAAFVISGILLTIARRARRNKLHAGISKPGR
jgi:membrane-bound ClpP family serine protease